MKYTENYNLKKPELSDIANVLDFGENFDVIDEKLKELEDGMGTEIEIVDNLESTATNKALSANQGRVLKGMIQEVKYIKHNFDNGGLDQYFAAYNALKAGGTGVYNICFIGDSAGEGAHCDPNKAKYPLKSYVGLLNAAYSRKFDDLGWGFIPVHMPYGSNSPWFFDDDWYSLENEGFGVSKGNMYSDTQGATVNYYFYGTGVKVVAALSPVGGSFSAKIDGVSKGTFSVASGSSEFVGAAEIEIAAAGTLDSLNHNLEITVQSGPVMLIGAYALTNAAKGFRMIRSCRDGATVGSHIFSDFVLDAGIDFWQPKLTIIALIANDIMYETSLNDYKAGLQTLIDHAKLTGDALLYAYIQRGDFSGEAHIPYINAMKEVSDTNNVPMIDAITPYLDKYMTLDLYADDLYHPNDKGHQLMAKPLIYELLP